MWKWIFSLPGPVEKRVSEGQGRLGEEVHGHDHTAVIEKESCPRLAGLVTRSQAPEIAQDHRSLRSVLDGVVAAAVGCPRLPVRRQKARDVDGLLHAVKLLGPTQDLEVLAVLTHILRTSAQGATLEEAVFAGGRLLTTKQPFL